MVRITKGNSHQGPVYYMYSAAHERAVCIWVSREQYTSSSLADNVQWEEIFSLYPEVSRLEVAVVTGHSPAYWVDYAEGF